MIPNFSDQRQFSGATRLVSIFMLCLATGTLLGFSNPYKLQVENDQPGDHREKGSPLARADNEVILPDTAPILRAAAPAPRLFSFVPGVVVKKHSMLGGINGRLWFDPSAYSPDRAIADLHTKTVGEFHGVGFPDIRTFRKKIRRHNPLNPQPWAPMITWRKRHGAQLQFEPIAQVRCMGLSPQAVARRADQYNKLILDYSIKYNISASLIKAVISVESCFNNKALSPVGAQGLMQLMPRTASWLKVRDPHNPADNLKAGIRYLAALREQFKTLELALAAYNAGPGNVRRYGGVPPFSETRAYVRKVQANYRRYAAATLVASR